MLAEPLVAPGCHSEQAAKRRDRSRRQAGELFDFFARGKSQALDPRAEFDRLARQLAVRWQNDHYKAVVGFANESLGTAAKRSATNGCSFYAREYRCVLQNLEPNGLGG